MKVNMLKLSASLLPKDFRHIAQPPSQLFYRGSLDGFANRPRLAVVGSRRASPYGMAVTTKLVSELARQGVVIVSGLALGIDSIAHKAALDSGGTTVAVLACGVDRIYPASHTALGNQILSNGGALISEYPEGTEPLPFQFIARNRIISGLSDAVLVTEAAEKSGSLHTANFALDQGRTVLAVPGNINSPYSVGTNNLIKSGALTVTNSKDILLALGLDPEEPLPVAVAANKEEALILNLLQKGITDSAQLMANSKLDAVTFNQTLTMLEITGKIRPLGAGHWTNK